MGEKMICSRCEEPMVRMYRLEFINTNCVTEHLLLRSDSLKNIVLCETCCNQIINNITKDDILDKIIMLRESQGLTLEEIADIVHKNRDFLSKKYSKYLKKAVKIMPQEHLDKVAALYKAGWSIKEIYFDFRQKYPLDVIAKVVTGKMWKNFKPKEK